MGPGNRAGIRRAPAPNQRRNEAEHRGHPFKKPETALGETASAQPGGLPVSGDQRRRSPGLEAQRVPEPWEGIDARNGWHDDYDPALPMSQFADEGSAFDPDQRISLCGQEVARLFQWLLFGGSVRNRDRSRAVNLKLKRICEQRDFDSVLKRPQLIGYRLVAMLLRIRPELLNGLCAAQLARRLQISPRAMAYHTISFGENFPLGSKSIRRTSRLVNEEIRRARHKAKTV